MTGFHLIIGPLPGLGPGVSREANNCRVDIGNHVWVGKDVKIGKNARISDHRILGWGSIVSKEFDEPHVILAGMPAKIVKRGINWDRRCINKYLKQSGYTAP